ncbi:MAG: MinD/ParA family protein [Firmicutes bacterium]|nr:MinD/ParA family protein [Bacillota bacterium]MDD4693966.1 MinD/ParA family protein [Bacillota bacterium]
MQDQADGLRRLAQKSQRIKKRRKTRTIVVTSGKGGVGKSSFSLNFALALKEQGFEVGILDADLGLANLDLMMGVSAPFNISHLISGKKTLKEILLKGPGGIYLIPGGSGIMSIALLDQAELSVLLDSLTVLDEYLDFLIIDTGAGISKQVLTFALAADEIMVVSTPDPTSLADAFGIIKIIDRGNPKSSIGIVVNQADNQKHGALVFNRLDIVCKKFAGRDLNLIAIIPSDSTLSEAIRAQVPLMIYKNKCKGALAIKKAALDYLKRNTLKTGRDSFEEGGLRGFIRKMVSMLK